MHRCRKTYFLLYKNIIDLNFINCTFTSICLLPLLEKFISATSHAVNYDSVINSRSASKKKLCRARTLSTFRNYNSKLYKAQYLRFRFRSTGRKMCSTMTFYRNRQKIVFVISRYLETALLEFFRTLLHSTEFYLYRTSHSANKATRELQAPSCNNNLLR